MGFFSNLASAAVKVVSTPVAALKDVVNVAVGEEPDATKKLLESVGEDVKDAVDDLSDGEVI